MSTNRSLRDERALCDVDVEVQRVCKGGETCSSISCGAISAISLSRLLQSNFVMDRFEEINAKLAGVLSIRRTKVSSLGRLVYGIQVSPWVFVSSRDLSDVDTTGVEESCRVVWPILRVSSLRQ